MKTFLLRAALAAVAATGLMSDASAQAPLPQPAPPKVIRWPGGWMMTDGSEMILRNSVPGAGTTNIIGGSGNGFGNRIVVGGGSGGGTTIISNSRNGIGNKIVLDPDDWLIDLDDWCPPKRPVPAGKPLPPAVQPLPALPAEQPMVPVAPQVYEGKANAFWTKKAFSDALDCNVYWSEADKLWYRYFADGDKYKPLEVQPPAPQE